MKVFIVYEEDRGLGGFPVGVFESEKAAKDSASESSHYYVMEAEFYPDVPEVEE